LKSTLVCIFIALAAPPTWAATPPSLLRKEPNLAKAAEALPTLVGDTQAIARINRALRAANARQLPEMKDCLRDAPQDGFWWEQAAEMTLFGARFTSFYRHGNFSCGGAHANFIMDGFVFDLRTGERVDWQKLLPAELVGNPGKEKQRAPLAADDIASPQLTALFVAASEKESSPECKEEIEHQELRFQLWPDAKAKGLAIHTYGLPHRVEVVCAGPVTIPLEMLKKLGVNAALLWDIETGRHELHRN
jgi:hypothetical protein